MFIKLASTQDFSLLCGRYNLPAPVRYNPGEAGFPGTSPQIRAIAKVGAAAEKISISSALQRAEHDKRNAADRTGTGYALIFAAGDIQKEQHSRYSRHAPPSPPFKPFCQTFIEFCL